MAGVEPDRPTTLFCCSAPARDRIHRLDRIRQPVRRYDDEVTRSIDGPFLGTLDASAVTVRVVTGFAEFLGYSVRYLCPASIPYCGTSAFSGRASRTRCG